MKQLAILCIAVALAAFSQSARADITVGTPNFGDCYPFLCNADGSAGQSIQYEQVYSSISFAGPLAITSETFYWKFAQRYGGNDTLLGGTYVFDLSTTSAHVNGLSSTLANNIGSDNIQVGVFVVPPGGESFGDQFTFRNTTPFHYQPTAGNLLLEISVFNQDGTPNMSGNSYNDADLMGAVTSRAYALDGSVSGPVDGTGLVTTFNLSGVPEPSSLLPLVALCGFGVHWLHRKGIS
jgi:hypothetical protein